MDPRKALCCILSAYVRESGSQGDPAVARFCVNPDAGSVDDYGTCAALTALMFFAISITDDQKTNVWNDALGSCGCPASAPPSWWIDTTPANQLAMALAAGCA